jgi:hypothetical protein
MAARTKAGLADEVLRQLGILAAVDTAAAEDSAYVEGSYDTRHAELRDKGLCYWPNTGRAVAEIPEAVFNALVDIVMDDSAAAFGVKLEPVVDLDTNRPMSIGARGMRNLRRHMMKRPSGEPTRAVYY